MRRLLLSLLLSATAFASGPRTYPQSSGGGGSGVTTVDSAPTGSNSNGLVITGTGVHCTVADASNPGCQSSANFTKANAAATSVGTVSGTSTANGLDLTANVLTGHVADASNPGFVTAAWADLLARMVPIRHPRTVNYFQSGTTNATGVAGQVYLEQIELGPVKGKLYRGGFLVGTTPGGNWYLGLYGPVDTSGNPPYTCQGTSLVSSTASTVGSGGATNNTQYANIVSAVYHQPGLYCLALETDGTSVNFYRQNQSRGTKNAWQFFTQTFGALPATVPTVTNPDEANNFPILDVDVIP